MTKSSSKRRIRFIGSEPSTLDPQLRDDGGERQVNDNIYETLMARTAAGELVEAFNVGRAVDTLAPPSGEALPPVPTVSPFERARGTRVAHAAEAPLPLVDRGVEQDGDDVVVLLDLTLDGPAARGRLGEPAAQDLRDFERDDHRGGNDEQGSAEGCAAEYAQLDRSWSRLLRDHLREEAKHVADAPPSSTGTKYIGTKKR